MILLIWSIYVIFAGKYQLAKHCGVTGGFARLCGVFNLLVALGIVGALIPIQEPLLNFGIQLLMIVVVGLLAVAVHGNDFKKPAGPDGTPVDVRPTATKGAAIFRSGVAFIGWYFLLTIGIMILVTQLLLQPNDIANIPSIPNVVVRSITWILTFGLPLVGAGLLARRRYCGFEIIQE